MNAIQTATPLSAPSPVPAGGRATGRARARGRRALALAAVMLTGIVGVTPAHAQLSVLGSPTQVHGALVRGSDPQHDPVNDVYLVVTAYGPVAGIFVNALGVPVTSAFLIKASTGGVGFSAYVRAKYSPEANGGNGGFLVAWASEDVVNQPSSIRTQMVAYPGVLVGNEQIISESTSRAWGEAAPAIGYSRTSRRFLVAWQGFGPYVIQSRLVGLDGAPIGSVVALSNGSFDRDPGVTWNPNKDHFGVSFGGEYSAGAFAAFAIVPASNPAAFSRNTFAFVPGGQTAMSNVEFNPQTNRYVMSWYQSVGARTAEFNESGEMMSARLASGSIGTYDGLSMAYNPISKTFLLVGTNPYTDELAGAELNSAGERIGADAVLGTAKALYPRVGASQKAAQWMTISSKRLIGILQGVQTGTSGSPSPSPPPGPPPCSFTVNDTSASAAGTSSTGALTVSTTENCEWTVTANASWLSVSPTSGRGPGAVQWTAEANHSGAARSGTITIAGKTFTVNQAVLVFTVGDFNGDASPDFIWRNGSTGDLAVWRMRGLRQLSGAALTPSRVPDTGWKVVGSSDMNRDGFSDLLWQHDNGWLAVWWMRGETMMSGELITASPLSDLGWRVVGSGDLDRDGWPDLLWQHTDGRVSVWYMRGKTFLSGQVIIQPLSDQAWRVAGVADMNRDGNLDLVWHHRNTGHVALWLMNRSRLADAMLMNESAPDTRWQPRGLGDFDGDGDVDVLWQNDATGALATWQFHQLRVTGAHMLDLTVSDTFWKVVAPR